MYFSRMTFNPQVNLQQLSQTLCSDSYREHQALWQLFDTDPEAKRDFLYRQAIEQGQIKYYVLSERQPVDDTGLWNITPPKKYMPDLVEGQKLFFMLRANPVKTIVNKAGKKQRHDVVMHKKQCTGYQQLPKNKRPPLQQIVQESCTQWLASCAETKGFIFDQDAVVVDGYQQHQSQAKRQSHSIRYSSVDFQGVLTVTDVEKFKLALLNGIGKSKAFGCGLMLVRRA